MQSSERPQAVKGLQKETDRKLKYAIQQYRVSVRWLRDASIYKQKFSGDVAYNGEVWKEGIEAELAKDAQKAWNEAVSTVLYWRGQINKYNDSLMKMAEEKIND